MELPLPKDKYIDQFDSENLSADNFFSTAEMIYHQESSHQ